VLEPRVFPDSRGFFFESYNERTLAELGINDHFVQDNHSKSQKGVLRGLHYQLVQPQSKLVRVSRGEIFDVAVDLRRSSPQFGQWTGARLSAENKRMLYVPKGFAHGFLVLSDEAELLYKASDFYAPQGERTLLWNDPEVGIEWPGVEDLAPMLSAKDEAGKWLRDADVFERGV
jgi:dTDP-4-dehydrorhamnose 3,5-epimerase